jgi:hypothetical protein
MDQHPEAVRGATTTAPGYAEEWGFRRPVYEIRHPHLCREALIVKQKRVAGVQTD